MKIKQIPRKRARIEMIPLIDSMFLLLVFFIYAMLSMVVHKGISVDLPVAATSVIDKEDYLSLSITREKKIFFDKREVSFRELPLFLRQEREKNPKLELFINADKKAYYGRIIKVLDVIRAAGIKKVSFETGVGDEDEW